MYETSKALSCWKFVSAFTALSALGEGTVLALEILGVCHCNVGYTRVLRSRGRHMTDVSYVLRHRDGAFVML